MTIAFGLIYGMTVIGAIRWLIKIIDEYEDEKSYVNFVIVCVASTIWPIAMAIFFLGMFATGIGSVWRH